MAFLRHLFAQVFSDGARIDAERHCVYNGWLGVLLLAGAFILRFSGPPDLLGVGGFVLAVVGAVVLLAALVVRSTAPRLVPTLLAAQGVVVVALTIAFALSSVFWALGSTATRAFRYLPGLLLVGATYGSALEPGQRNSSRTEGDADVERFCRGLRAVGGGRALPGQRGVRDQSLAHDQSQLGRSRPPWAAPGAGRRTSIRSSGVRSRLRGRGATNGAPAPESLRHRPSRVLEPRRTHAVRRSDR